MEAKKYLASILTASLLLGFQVKANDTKEEETLKNIETIVSTEAKNEGVSTESWYKENQKVILGVAGAAVVGGGIVGAWVYGKHVGEKKDERAFQSSIIAYKKRAALPKTELEAEIKKCTDANTVLEKEIKDLSEAISKLDKDKEAKVLAAKNEVLTKKNKEKQKNEALVDENNAIIKAQAANTVDALLTAYAEKVAKKDIAKKTADLTKAYAEIAEKALKKAEPAKTVDATKEAATTKVATKDGEKK